MKLLIGINKLPDTVVDGAFIARAPKQSDVVCGYDKYPPRRDAQPTWYLIIPLRFPDREQEGIVIIGPECRPVLSAAIKSSGTPKHRDGAYIPEAGAFIKIRKDAVIDGRYYVHYRRPEKETER